MSKLHATRSNHTTKRQERMRDSEIKSEIRETTISSQRDKNVFTYHYVYSTTLILQISRERHLFEEYEIRTNELCKLSQIDSSERGRMTCSARIFTARIITFDIINVMHFSIVSCGRDL